MSKRIIPAVFFGCVLALSMEAQTIQQRQENQQDRIAQGVKSGELTPKETAKLERREAKLNRKIAHDRKTGGRLTAKERARIARQQNRASAAIHAQKHDGQEMGK